MQSLSVPRGPSPSVPELWQDEDEAQWLLKLAKARVAAEADAPASEAAAADEAEWRAALARARARDAAREPELAHTTSTVRAIPAPPEAEPDWDAVLQVARARAAQEEARGLLQPKGPQPARPPKPRRPAQSGSFPAVSDADVRTTSVRRLPPPIPRRSSASGASADPFAPLVPFTPPQREAHVVAWPPVALKAG